MLSFGNRIIPFIFLSLLFLLSIFLCIGWMGTSPAGSYDGNWPLIVGCLPCVVGHHLQLVVFRIGSHLSLGNIGKKTEVLKTWFPWKWTNFLQKRDHLKRRGLIFLNHWNFHDIRSFWGEHCPETKSFEACRWPDDYKKAGILLKKTHGTDNCSS